MVPSHWMALSQLPNNGNGKIDRRKVQELFAVELQANRVAAQRLDGTSDPSSESNETLRKAASTGDSVQLTTVRGPR
jgi:hypothetical protein